MIYLSNSRLQLAAMDALYDVMRWIVIIAVQNNYGYKYLENSYMCIKLHMQVTAAGLIYELMS